MLVQLVLHNDINSSIIFLHLMWQLLYIYPCLTIAWLPRYSKKIVRGLIISPSLLRASYLFIVGPMWYNYMILAVHNDRTKVILLIIIIIIIIIVSTNLLIKCLSRASVWWANNTYGVVTSTSSYKLDCL